MEENESQLDETLAISLTLAFDFASLILRTTLGYVPHIPDVRWLDAFSARQRARDLAQLRFGR